MILCIYTHKSRLGVQASPSPPQALSGPAGLPSAAPAWGAPAAPVPDPAGSSAASAADPDTHCHLAQPLPTLAGAPPCFPLHLLSYSELPPSTSGRPYGGAASPGSAGSCNGQPPMRGMFRKALLWETIMGSNQRPRAHLFYWPVPASLSVIKSDWRRRAVSLLFYTKPQKSRRSSCQSLAVLLFLKPRVLRRRRKER